MSENYKTAIDALMAELQEKLKPLKDLKESINKLSLMDGKDAPFKDVETGLSITSGVSNIRNDQFFGMGVATAVKEYLRLKSSAATAQEIYNGLIKGGFVFPTEWKEKLWLKNLAISIRKNTDGFVYIKSSNSFGLYDFYPDLKKEKLMKKVMNAKDVEEIKEVIENDVMEDLEKLPEISKKLQ